jgi:hypothetical protein
MIVGLGVLAIASVRLSREVTKQVHGMGQEPGLTRRGFHRAAAEVSRIVVPTEQQTGAPQRVVRPAPMANDSRRRQTLENLLALADARQRFAHLSELCRYPSGRPDCERK